MDKTRPSLFTSTMKEAPPNPYRDATLRELRDTMSIRANELLKEGVQVGRRDIAYLLIAAASRLSPRSARPNSPNNRVREGENIVEVFWPEFENDVKATRHHVLQHAVEATGLTFEQIRDYQARTLCSLSALAAKSDDGLREALGHLVELTRNGG